MSSPISHLNEVGKQFMIFISLHTHSVWRDYCDAQAGFWLNSKFLSKFSRKPLSVITDQKAPLPQKFRFEVTKVFSRIPPTPKFRFEVTKVYSGIPPQKFRFEVTKVFSRIPPQKFRFEVTKVYSRIPFLFFAMHYGSNYMMTSGGFALHYG